jgi:hypothetical protein
MPPKKSNGTLAVIKQTAAKKTGKSKEKESVNKKNVVSTVKTSPKTSVAKKSSGNNENNDNMFNKMKTEWLSISELIVEKQNELEQLKKQQTNLIEKMLEFISKNEKKSNSKSENKISVKKSEIELSSSESDMESLDSDFSDSEESESDDVSSESSDSDSD